MKAEIDISAVADKMGELCGAARGDWANADPSDVGLNGVPVKCWRDAYFEGCKDMAESITARLPAEHHDAVREIARSAFSKAFAATQNSADQQQAPRNRTHFETDGCNPPDWHGPTGE